ncbi:MAG: thioredoxin family protein [Acholeplasma sp.]|nr:thioredoxin family protein [Acholeplasma sp.]
MEIKVLGSGCANCKKLLENVKEAVKNQNVNATIHYVTDMMEIAKAGLLRTPGLMIDGKVASYGKVLSVSEVEALLK